MAATAIRKAVLVLTSVEDGTADPVIHHLIRRNIPVVRMDPGDFPSSMTVEAEFGPERWRGTVHDTFRGVELESVRSVYYRRPSQFTLPEGMSGPEQRWAYREARMGFGGVLLSLDCLWINLPGRMSTAEYKPVQLTTAVAAGLTVPRTIITSAPEYAADWAATVPGPIVYKPLGGALHTVHDEGQTGETALNPASLREPAVAFLAQLATVDADTVLKTADDGTDFLFMEGADGSWAEVDMAPIDGRFSVVGGGPRRLWQAVENTHSWWIANEQPDWSTFGVTVTPDDQYVWHESPSSGARWELPT